MKNKYSIVLCFIYIFLPLLIIVYILFDMSSVPNIKITEENVYLDAPLCSSMTIGYEDIDEIEYINELDFGKKVKGKNNNEFIAGIYRNKEFGDYYVVAYNGCDKYIKIKCKNEIYIFNLETVNQTKESYDFISKK
ncbi:MAG: hypothetical protein KHZ15_10605 [Coprobacillus cateniformis]|uniref:PH domain-containing protein n=1 Tax=Longibaculum muris TaxID=1796628 RepID=UPI003AB8ABB7|nr:hypothetical protein [Coprobacillus cateniformis]